MDELLVCRVCLATDVRLYNMYKYELVSAYESFSGYKMSISDGLPHQICSYCAALLSKCVRFHEKCQNSQQMLHCAILENKMLTLDYIRSLRTNFDFPRLTYTTVQNVITIKEEEDDLATIINNIIDRKDNIKVENEVNSDEEPLAAIVKKNKRHKRDKKRVKEKECENELEIIEEAYDNISIKDEDVQMDFPIELNDNFKDDFGDDLIDDCDDKIQFEFDGTEVVVLSKLQQKEDLQARKESQNYKNCQYKCEVCYKGFMTEITYQNHMVKHDPSYGPYSCDICKLRWPNNRTLRSHISATHQKKYICRRCGFVCRSNYKAKEHIRWHEGYLYTCDICGATFNKPTSHLTHVRLQHPSEHTCSVCHESFISEIGLKQHANKAHRAEQIKPVEVKLETQCVVCCIQFRSEDALQRHRSYAEDGVCDQSYKPCVTCGERFTNRIELREHVRNVHQNHKCVECNKKFANSKSLAVHFHRVHLGIKANKSPNKSVVCETCGKKCKSLTTFMYHRRIHSGEKPYQCNECPKKFSVYQRLQIHMRTHTGERPFKCNHCPKAFKHKAALNRHDRVHTGAKPYSCLHCGKAFSQSNSMKTHVRSVHLKLPGLYRRPPPKQKHYE